MTDKIPMPADGLCQCGCDNLMLAEDFTQYSPLKLQDGTWKRLYTSDMELSGSLEPTRIYCPECGAEYELPEELPGEQDDK